MPGVTEPIGIGEQVLTILRKEGDDMKPSDTQCQALVGFDEDESPVRCEGEVVFSTESGNWLVWCQEHKEQEDLARAEGEERVRRVTVQTTES